MPACTARANAVRSAVRARVEHAFAWQNGQMGLFIRTLGIVRAEAKIGVASLASSFDRLSFYKCLAAMGEGAPGGGWGAD